MAIIAVPQVRRVGVGRPLFQGRGAGRTWGRTRGKTFLARVMARVTVLGFSLPGSFKRAFLRVQVPAESVFLIQRAQGTVVPTLFKWEVLSQLWQDPCTKNAVERRAGRYSVEVRSQGYAKNRLRIVN